MHFENFRLRTLICLVLRHHVTLTFSISPKDLWRNLSILNLFPEPVCISLRHDRSRGELCLQLRGSRGELFLQLHGSRFGEVLLALRVGQEFAKELLFPREFGHGHAERANNSELRPIRSRCGRRRRSTGAGRESQSRSRRGGR